MSSYRQLLYHIVFRTKNSMPSINPEHADQQTAYSAPSELKTAEGSPSPGFTWGYSYRTTNVVLLLNPFRVRIMLPAHKSLVAKGIKETPHNKSNKIYIMIQ